MKKYADSLDDIIVAAAEYFDIPVGVIKDPEIRTHAVVRARHIAQYLACKLTFLSKRQIADGFNLKDHTAVIYAFNRVGVMLANDDAEAKKSIRAITEELKLPVRV